MRLPDGTILIHESAPYDPQKAHDYYIRTRHLKGRRKGGVVRGAPNGSSPSASNYSVKLADGTTATLTQQQLDEQVAYAAKRVEDIKNKLSILTDKLKELMAAAQKAKPAQPPTAAQKAAAAKKAKQYRQSHKQQLANKRKAAVAKPSTPAPSKTSTTNPVADLQQKISQIKGALTAAVAKQRELLGATKNG